jgi:hypothetical protein
VIAALDIYKRLHKIPVTAFELSMEDKVVKKAPAKNPAAVRLGRLGGMKKKTLTDKQRREIAERLTEARKKIPKAKRVQIAKKAVAARERKRKEKR